MCTKFKTLIVSPSGNLYGSERVLIDYLNTSQLFFSLFVPENSQLQKKILSMGLKVRIFNSLAILYLKVFFELLFNSGTRLYLNEGGHIKYVRLLAKFFPKRKFYVHLRLVSDADSKRLGSEMSNIVLISVSEFLADHITWTHKEVMLDPFVFAQNREFPPINLSAIKVGVVGRVTTSKRLDLIQKVLESLKIKYENIEFHFFGRVEDSKEEVKQFIQHIEDIKVRALFHGFVDNTSQVYSKIDVLLHANDQETFGRVFLEALDFGVIPIVNKNGGTGEIAEIIQLSENALDFEGDEKLLGEKIEHILAQEEANMIYKEARQRAKKMFDIVKYSSRLDGIISES